MRMVCAGAKPSLRLASCCKVEVVNGGGGLRLAGLASTLATVKAAVSSACLNASASAPVPMSRRCPSAVGADQPRLELLAARRGEGGDQRPVFARNEFLDLELAVADEPQRHRLHAAGGARAGELAPQHRREGEADQVVERAAGEIGVDQGAVDAARMLHRLEHRLLGDGVEHHPLDRLLLERVLLLEDFQHVPGDRLALAIGVGGQDQLARHL